MLSGIESLYSKNGIVNLGKNPRIAVKKRTNRPSVDYLTDGGLPIGRMIIFAGEKSSGKSSAAIQWGPLIGPRILYVDTEFTLTSDYIKKLGCDPSNFDHAMPESTEKMCDLIRANVHNYDVIIIDSINNSASEQQLEKSANEKTMANRASVLSAQLPIIVGLCNQHLTTLIVVSQVRQNMNKSSKYEPDTIIPGGESLHHNSSMTLEFTQSATKLKGDSNEFEDKETVDGFLIRIKCSKNKVGEAYRKVVMDFEYENGYTEENDVIAAAIRLDVIKGSGAWYNFGDIKWNGKVKMAAAIKENKDLYESVKEAVNIKMEDIISA